jgi:hypothetical protein
MLGDSHVAGPRGVQALAGLCSGTRTRNLTAGRMARPILREERTYPLSFYS